MFRQNLKIMLFFTLVVMLYAFKHPYHVSVTTVSYYKKTQQINLEIKAFYHDLEPAVNKFANLDIDIKNHSNIALRDSAVYAYIDQKFNVLNNGQQVAFSKAGISFKDEYILVRLLIQNITPGKLSIQNSICYEIEKSQTQLFHFKWGEKKQTRKIVNPEKQVEFVYN